jgi:hypothetical protein
VIWLLSGDGRGDFWPVWVIVPWGALLLLRTVAGFAGGAPTRQQYRDQYRRDRWERRQARRDRRWG